MITNPVNFNTFPPTGDEVSAAIAIAGRDIAPTFERARAEYGPTVLVGAFVMLADILTAFGLTEKDLIWLARAGFLLNEECKS